MVKNRPIGLFPALCWILLAAPAAGQLPPQATALNNLGARFYSEGSLSRAEPLYQSALAEAEQAPIPDPLGIAKIRSNLAALCRRQGRYREAAALYATVVELRQKALGPAHPEVAVSLNNLAEIYRLQGRYWEARQLLKQALGMLPTDSADRATVLNNLADIECVYGKYAAANNCCGRLSRCSGWTARRPAASSIIWQSSSSSVAICTKRRAWHAALSQPPAPQAISRPA